MPNGSVPVFLSGSAVAGAHIAGQGNEANHNQSRRALSRWVMKPMTFAFLQGRGFNGAEPAWGIWTR